MTTETYISIFSPPTWSETRQRWLWSNEPFMCEKQPWTKVLEWLHDCAGEPYQRKEDAPLFAPALFADNRRSNKNVQNFGAIVLDIDDGTTLKDATNRLTGSGLEAALYTTASHAPNHHKFRVVMPLADLASPTDYPVVWQTANSLLGETVDPQTKDLARISYVPGDYAGTPNQFHHVAGAILSSADWVDIGRDLMVDQQTGSPPTGLPARERPAKTHTAPSKHGCTFGELLTDAIQTWYHQLPEEPDETDDPAGLLA